MGPNATARPEVAPQMPRAFCRSEGFVNTDVKIARVAGKTKAAAIPMSARAAMSWPVEVLRAARTENTPKNTSPTCITPLRPSRSPTPPPASSSPAKARL